MSLIDLSLSVEVSTAINDFLFRMMEHDREDFASYLGSYRIDQLVLDSSTHTDEALAALLKNLSTHKTIDNLSISNCKFGPKSIACLVDLSSKLFELRLANL